MKRIKLTDPKVLLISLGFNEDETQVILKHINDHYLSKMLSGFDHVYFNRLTLTMYSCFCYYLLYADLTDVNNKQRYDRESLLKVIGDKHINLVRFLLSKTGDQIQKNILRRLLLDVKIVKIKTAEIEVVI